MVEVIIGNMDKIAVGAAGFGFTIGLIVSVFAAIRKVDKFHEVVGSMLVGLPMVLTLGVMFVVMVVVVISQMVKVFI